MTNCDTTNIVYSFERNLATIWVGVNRYTVGFFQNFDLLVQRYVSPSFFSLHTISSATNFSSERADDNF